MTGGTSQAYVALGANLENPVQQVRQAMRELDGIAHTRVIAASSLYRTAPVGYADQPDFVNAVASVRTALSAHALLDALHEIENRHGRRRSVRNAPRTLDLDLLTYDDLVLDEGGLTLPHPRMHERAFVLMPLAEIAPAMKLPGGRPIAELLHDADRSGVAMLDGTRNADGA